jgi:hypothetical protein
MALDGGLPDHPPLLPDEVQSVWATQLHLGRGDWIAGSVWRGDSQGWHQIPNPGWRWSSISPQLIENR